MPELAEERRVTVLALRHRGERRGGFGDERLAVARRKRAQSVASQAEELMEDGKALEGMGCRVRTRLARISIIHAGLF
jgi:hypothetical protein